MKLKYHIKNLFNNNYKYIDNNHILIDQRNSINNIPASISSISTRNYINNNNLPKLLKCISLYNNLCNYKYNSIEKYNCTPSLGFITIVINNLPKIEILLIDKLLNTKINNLPTTIHKLIFYSYKIINNLCGNIQFLKYGLAKYIKTNNLPKKLNELYACNYINNLPSKIKILEFTKNTKINNLPNSIIKLICGLHFNNKIDKLPNSIIHLSLNEKFNQSLDFISENLQILDIKYNIEIKKINDLPSGIKTIIINKNQKNVINSIYKSKIKIEN